MEELKRLEQYLRLIREENREARLVIKITSDQRLYGYIHIEDNEGYVSFPFSAIADTLEELAANLAFYID